MAVSDGFSDGLFRGFIVGAMVGALAVAACGCDPYPRDHYDRAALALPSCWAPGAVFAVPPELCPEFLRIWRLSVEAHGAKPPGTWRVMATATPEAFMNGTQEVRIWGRTYCENGRIEVAEHPNGWCASALAHEFAHALECSNPDPAHRTWAERGVWDRVVAVQSDCQWEMK